jgi:hypothetical protein
VVAAQSVQAAAFNGMSYTTDFSNNEIGDAAGLQSLLKMSQMGTNLVTMNVWWFQSSTTATTIASNTSSKYSTSDASLETAINYAHSLGMKVLLKPMVDVNNGTWRGSILPSGTTNVNAWFTSYTSFMDHYAQIAHDYNVDMFSMGCELCKMEQFTSNWNSLINNVHGIYSGPLTYAANWSPNGTGGYRQIAWWNNPYLTDIGIDAYFPLTTSTSPTLTQLQQAWTNIATTGQTNISGDEVGLQNWMAQNGYLNLANPNDPNNKKLLFTECGYTSQDGTNKSNSSQLPNTTPIDLQEQADCYRALMSVMSQYSWWDGANWWNWTSNPNDGGTSNTNYTPQNKIAQQTLSEFYLMRGDFDLDHKITNADLQAMLNALRNLSTFQNNGNTVAQGQFFSNADLNTLGDFNGDGVLNAADIQGELSLLAGGGGSSTSSVPEPASMVLLGLAALICSAAFRRHHIIKA